MKKAIVLLSGGIDSTVLTYWLKQQGYDLTAITFSYNQEHRKEVYFAFRTCKKLLILCFLSQLNLPFNVRKQIVVPNRNMIFLSVATGLAEELKIKTVFYAAHHSDRQIFPDCRSEFVEALSEVTRLVNGVEIVAPFIEYKKEDLVKLGQKLKVPFENTWSCYEGREKACGKCLACRERLQAFKKNNIKDPIQYENQKT